MEAVKCHHREQVEYTPALPGIEVGTCSKCGQVIQYDHNAVPTKVSVTRLGRLDGNIVLPKHGLKLLLSAEDKGDLKAALSASAAEPAPPPSQSRRIKRKMRNEYFEQNKEAIIHDYYLMKLIDVFDKWGLSSNVWKRLKELWQVTPKGPVNRFTRQSAIRTRQPAKGATGSNGALPSFPPFNEEWSPQVKIEWFKTYKELRLASGEK